MKGRRHTCACDAVWQIRDRSADSVKTACWHVDGVLPGQVEWTRVAGRRMKAVFVMAVAAIRTMYTLLWPLKHFTDSGATLVTDGTDFHAGDHHIVCDIANAP